MSKPLSMHADTVKNRIYQSCSDTGELVRFVYLTKSAINNGRDIVWRNLVHPLCEFGSSQRQRKLCSFTRKQIRFRIFFNRRTARADHTIDRFPQIEMFQNTPDQPRAVDQRYYFHLTLALRATHGIDLPDFLDQLAPVLGWNVL